jgi:hypothetical protein
MAGGGSLKTTKPVFFFFGLHEEKLIFQPSGTILGKQRPLLTGINRQPPPFLNDFFCVVDREGRFRSDMEGSVLGGSHIQALCCSIYSLLNSGHQVACASWLSRLSLAAGPASPPAPSPSLQEGFEWSIKFKPCLCLAGKGRSLPFVCPASS